MEKIRISDLDVFVNGSKFKTVIVTLYEGHYHIGVASLINSVYKAGFEGLIRIGFKGDLPPWTKQLDKHEDGLFSIGNACLLHFVQVDVSMHFGYFKPNFLKETFQKYPSVEKVNYFDPDIVVLAPWTFYNEWTNAGVSVCLDNCFPFVHRNHPWRSEWRQLDNLLESNNHIDQYANSGFVGLNRNAQAFADKWIQLTDTYRKRGGDVSMFEKEGHRAFKGDQDIMNAAITVSPEIKISFIGTEGMGFSFPAYLMAHAVGNVKPWKQNYILNIFFKGIRPGFAAKKFYEFCDSPIQIYNRFYLIYKKISIKLAAFLGRFFA